MCDMLSDERHRLEHAVAHLNAGEIEDVIGEEHRLAVRITFAGTHVDPLLGFAPSGRRVSVGGITILHYDRGRVVERWRAFDDLGLVRRIGAMEPVGARA